MTRKSKSSSLSPADLYLQQLREDEDPKDLSHIPDTPRGEWKDFSAEEKDRWIASCEAATLQRFGCFPKANWMR